MLESFILQTIAFTLFFYYVINLIKEYFKFNSMQTKWPRTLPLSIIAYVFTLFSEADRLKILLNLSHYYEDYFGVWFGPKYLIVTDDPQISQKLLTLPECLEKNFIMDIFGFPNGLLSIKSDRWKSERKLLNHAFSISSLQNYIPIFNECIIESLEKIKVEDGKGEFDIQKYVSGTTMDAVLRTTYGKKFDHESVERFIETAEKLLGIIWRRSMNPILYSNYVYSFTQMKKSEDQSRQFIFDYAERLGKEKCLEIESDNGSSLSKISFLYQLMKISDNGRNYSQEEINDHIGTLIIAAGDSTCCALGYVFLMLAIHQEVQDKVYAELSEIFGNNGQLDINYEDLSKLKFTEMAIKESLRLFNPVFGIFREVKADVDLGIKNISLPKGTNLVINLYSMHRKESIWGDNAGNYDPNHFSPENVQKRHPYSFIPFANGTRMCVGNKYSMIFMKLIVAHYIMNYKFTSPMKYEDVKVKAGVTIKIVGKHLVKIQKRH